MNKNIYFPSKEDLKKLDDIINNEVKIYDYLTIKIFEQILWHGYNTDNLLAVLEAVIESLNQYPDVILRHEIKTALIKMYPEVLINMQCLKDEDEIQLALSMVPSKSTSITDLSAIQFCNPILLKFCLERLKENLEICPRYRFEYRTKNNKNDSLLDKIFSLKLDSEILKNIDVETLKCLLYIDPMYVTKITDDDYKKIYENSGYVISDIEYIKRRDAILAIYDYIERYKITGNIWLRNHNENLSSDSFEKTIKLFMDTRKDFD